MKVNGVGWRLTWKQMPRVMLHHKPEGEIVSGRSGRPSSVFAGRHGAGRRWISVGLLDINTEGLLILPPVANWPTACPTPVGEVEREHAVRILAR